MEISSEQVERIARILGSPGGIALLLELSGIGSIIAHIRLSSEDAAGILELSEQAGILKIENDIPKLTDLGRKLAESISPILAGFSQTMRLEIIRRLTSSKEVVEELGRGNMNRIRRWLMLWRPSRLEDLSRIFSRIADNPGCFSRILRSQSIREISDKVKRITRKLGYGAAFSTLILAALLEGLEIMRLDEAPECRERFPRELLLERGGKIIVGRECAFPLAILAGALLG